MRHSLAFSTDCEAIAKNKASNTNSKNVTLNGNEIMSMARILKLTTSTLYSNLSLCCTIKSIQVKKIAARKVHISDILPRAPKYRLSLSNFFSLSFSFSVNFLNFYSKIVALSVLKSLFATVVLISSHTKNWQKRNSNNFVSQ